MIVGDIQRILESWAPKEIAWERDNVGLQVGESTKRIRNILVALDVSEEVLDEARRKRIDIIISHHPLLFHPIKSVSKSDRIGRMITTLIKNDIALYSAHTNLDFTRSGVSFTLAAQLGLHEIDFLFKNERVQKKLVVFVPADHTDNVMTAMAGAGAGHIGKYELCSFRSAGTGTFKASTDGKPFTGTTGQLERVMEVRLEMVLPAWKLNDVLRAMRSVHPYEEIAYDIYDLANASNDYGSGAIGELPSAVSLRSFLAMICRELNVSALRYSGDPARKIKRVAVCGGSGSELLQTAVQHGANAFVTADVRYHSFQETDERIVLIDAGHFETEHPVIRTIVNHLQTHCEKLKEKIKIIASTASRNPVQYYLS